MDFKVTTETYQPLPDMPLTEKSPWWDFLQAPCPGQTDGLGSDWAKAGLASRFLECGGEPVNSFSGYDLQILTGAEESHVGDLIAAATGCGLRIASAIPSRKALPDEAATAYSPRQVGYCEVSDCIFVDNDTLFKFSSDETDNSLSVGIHSTNQKTFATLLAAVKAVTGKRMSAGRVFVIVPEPGGFKFKAVGFASVPFEPGNYTKDVVEDFNFIVEDLNTPTPTGRVTILDGEPGTGKTYLVRSLVASVPEAVFVLVAPDMVQSLASPALIPALISLKDSTDVPLVFIVEDADSCLVPRQSDNMGSISAILNFSDGILGSLLDIRIVCTTNANIEQIDEAILRPGRLSKRVEVTKLDKAEATAAFQRLTNTDEAPFKDKFVSIAEVYRAARGKGWVPTKRKGKAGVGFRACAPDPDICSD